MPSPKPAPPPAEPVLTRPAVDFAPSVAAHLAGSPPAERERLRRLVRGHLARLRPEGAPVPARVVVAQLTCELNAEREAVTVLKLDLAP